MWQLSSQRKKNDIRSSWATDAQSRSWLWGEGNVDVVMGTNGSKMGKIIPPLLAHHLTKLYDKRKQMLILMHSCIHILEDHSRKVALIPKKPTEKKKIILIVCRISYKITWGILQDTVRQSTGLGASSFIEGNIEVGYNKHHKEVGSTFPSIFPCETNRKISQFDWIW